ncbi:MAG: carboxypeptidase-like regulatory domain-containing protein [Methanosarcinales archaeon]
MTAFNLNVGVFVVNISITSNNRTGTSISQFNIVQGTSNITGLVLNGTEPIPNAILELHDAKEYIANPKTSIPIKSTTTLSDGSYEFNEVSAGSYIITVYASRYINTSTFSFEITGTGETYTKNIIMVPSQIINTLAYLNPDMESLHSDTLGLMDYETDQIAEISIS